MKKFQYSKPVCRVLDFDSADVVKTSGGIIYNNTDVEVPDDFFNDIFAD